MHISTSYQLINDYSEESTAEKEVNIESEIASEGWCTTWRWWSIVGASCQSLSSPLGHSVSGLLFTVVLRMSR